MANELKNNLRENALERTVRHLGLLNMRFADAEVEGMQALTFTFDWHGNAQISNTNGDEIFGGTLEQVVAFLASPAAKQVALIRGRV